MWDIRTDTNFRTEYLILRCKDLYWFHMLSRLTHMSQDTLQGKNVILPSENILGTRKVIKNQKTKYQDIYNLSWTRYLLSINLWCGSWGDGVIWEHISLKCHIICRLYKLTNQITSSVRTPGVDLLLWHMLACNSF